MRGNVSVKKRDVAASFCFRQGETLYVIMNYKNDMSDRSIFNRSFMT